jgi:hypothetical protein
LLGNWSICSTLLQSIRTKRNCNSLRGNIITFDLWCNDWTYLWGIRKYSIAHCFPLKYSVLTGIIDFKWKQNKRYQVQLVRWLYTVDRRMVVIWCVMVYIRSWPLYSNRIDDPQAELRSRIRHLCWKSIMLNTNQKRYLQLYYYDRINDYKLNYSIYWLKNKHLDQIIEQNRLSIAIYNWLSTWIVT